jgi:hypothetical protein
VLRKPGHDPEEVKLYIWPDPGNQFFPMLYNFLEEAITKSNDLLPAPSGRRKRQPGICV